MARTTAALLVAAPLILPSTAALAGAQQVTELPTRERMVELEVEQLHSLGGMNAADWQLFGEALHVGFDENGVLHVLDGDNFRVLAVDPSGTLLWESGSQGGGPGEFGMPMSMAVAPDGSSVVYDLGHQAMVELDSNGAYVGQVSHGMDQGIPARGLFADPSGGVLYSGVGAVMVRQDGNGQTVQQGGGEEREPIRRVLAGVRDGVAYRAWRLSAMPMEMESGGGSGMRMAMPAMRAFEPGLFYAALPGGRLVVVDSVDYAVKVVGSNGTVERVLRRGIAPKKVGRAEREGEKKRQLDELAESGGPQARMVMRGGPGGSGGQIQTPDRGAMQAMLKGRLESMVFADHIPVIAGMRVDPWSGQIWIRRTGSELGEDGPIDIVTASGEYLGTLSANERLPDAFGPDGLVAYLVRDEFDVRSVEVVRISSLR